MRRLYAAGLIALSLLLVGGNLYATTCRLACALSALPGATAPKAAAAATAAHSAHADDDCSAVPLPAILDRPGMRLNHSTAAGVIIALSAAAAPSPVASGSQRAAVSFPVTLPRPARGVPLRV